MVKIIYRELGSHVIVNALCVILSLLYTAGMQSQHFDSERSSSPVNVPAATWPPSNVASHGSSFSSSPPQSDSGPSSMSESYHCLFLYE